MRFAVQIWGTDLDAIKAYARDAEAMGYDALRYGDGLCGLGRTRVGRCWRR
jgi:hypothetical protein